MSALLTQSAQSGYIAGLLIGVAILGFILTLVVAGVYSIASNATFAQATRTGGGLGCRLRGGGSLDRFVKRLIDYR